MLRAYRGFYDEIWKPGVRLLALFTPSASISGLAVPKIAEDADRKVLYAILQTID